MTEKVLAIIPARGGSKGVPRKNVRPMAGKPLIAWSIETALQCSRLDDVIVSTDDEEIARVSREYGAQVPFLRPPELAADSAPMVPVLRHAVGFMEDLKKEPYGYIVLLQPTDPIRLVEDIEGALDKLIATGADSVISVCRVDNVHPILMKKIVDDRLLPFCIEEKEGTRRQDYDPPAYMRNGVIYTVRRDVLMEQGSLWGSVSRPFVMPPERSVGIDSEIDFKLVELLLLEREGRAS